MIILAHRGYWNENIRKNSPKALRKALENGFGFESDIRDYMKHIVISHDPADSSCQDAEEVFHWLHEFNDELCFAINIKADGLKHLLKKYLYKYNISNYFLFDMSIPQMVEFKEEGLRFFTRQSEVEPNPCMYNDAAGVWVDSFWDNNWIKEDIVEQHISSYKKVCLVSPELHGRSYIKMWEAIKSWNIDNTQLMLCTDFPTKAKEYFS